MPLPTLNPDPAASVWTRGKGNLTKIESPNGASAICAYQQGAHITDWTLAGQPVLWMGEHSRFTEGQPIRGGIPVFCCPIWGADEACVIPMHGWARLEPWVLVGSDKYEAETTLYFNLNCGRSWKQYEGLRLRYEITHSDRLRLVMIGRNPTDHEMFLYIVFHTYFLVGNAAKCVIHGLHKQRYIDRAGGGSVRTLQEEETVTFGDEVDRLYPDFQGKCSVHDPDLRRDIEVSQPSGNLVAVWNPGYKKARSMQQNPGDLWADEWPRFICVETGFAGIFRAHGGAQAVNTTISVSPF